MKSLALAACLALIGLSGVACDYDIPDLPGGASTAGGSGAGGETCGFEGCPECVAPMICDPVMGCVQCRADTDCAAGAPICDNFRCVQCTLDDISNCRGGDTCFNGECDNTCDQAVDCGGGEDKCLNAICNGNRCVCCTSNANCVQDNENICDPSGICRECLGDADCVDPLAPKCRADGRCVACMVSEDCPQPAVCSPDNTCAAQCCETKDCVRGSDAPVCDTATSSCVACTDTAQCLNGDCLDGRCVECTADEECTDPELPACFNNACFACSESVMCAGTNNVCVENECYVME